MTKMTATTPKSPRRPLPSAMLPPLLSALLLLLSPRSPFPPALAHETARSLQIANESGRRVEVHWIHPDTGEMYLQSAPDILHGASFSLNTFVGHAFQVRELPAKRTGVCGGGAGEECRVDWFTVNENQDQVIMIQDGVEVDHTDSKTIASKSAATLLDDCKSTAKLQLADDPESAVAILEDLTNCVQRGIAVEIEKANEEIAFQATIRKDMGALVENYTCADEGVNTTEAKRIEHWETWDADTGMTRRKVSVFIDRPASRIHAIDDFLDAEECAAVEAAAAPLLHDATVADGSGGSKLSESRKARQAGIRVDWEKEGEGDPIARLSRRVYDYVNHVLPFDIGEEGQEDLMSIQYFGRGSDDEAPDRYMPHCDGDCNGMDFKPGNRMATIVMYCEIPKVGGATRFRNSNVHIRPKRFAATFFSYIDPAKMTMDSGFTEHSGCPVVEGEKKIVTQWVRLGVDNQNPWNSFNTLGIKISDAANQ